MASNNRRDVQLVISAKEQATKAFDAAAASLEKLLGVNTKVGASASQTGDRLGELASMAATLDKAYASISGSADKAEQAFNRQQASLAENKIALFNLSVQADNAKQAIERISKLPIAAGTKDQAGLSAMIASLEQIEKQQAKLQSTIQAQEAALNGQRSSLQQLSSTAIAAAEAQERLRIATEQETAASAKRNAEIAQEIQRREQAAAVAERMSAVQQRINALTGVDRDSAGSASASAAVLAEVAARDALIQKLKQEEAAQRELAQLREAQARSARLLPGDATTGKSAAESAAVFQQADIEATERMRETLRATTVAEREMADAAAKLRREIDPLAAAEAELNAKLDQANKLYGSGRISAIELAKATDLLKKNAAQARDALAAKGKPTLFGLSPYNVTNLSYQINDIFTQLASGTSITQTLAQQGGQILQIFPKVGEAIIGAFTNPRFLIFAATVGGLVLSLKKLRAEADQLKQFQTQLKATSEEGTYTAESMSRASEALRKLGETAEDSSKSITIFRKAGIDPTLFDAFAKSAKDAAKVLSKELPDAAKETADAFTRGYDAVKKLDDQYDFLSASERELIRNMFEMGDAAKARTAAFNIWSAKMAEAAANADDPWTRAWKNLTTSFNGFIDAIVNSSAIQFLNDLLNKTGKAVEYIAAYLPGANAQSAAAAGSVQRSPMALSPLDISYIVKTAIVEALPNNAQGQQDVASVVINRMLRSGLPASRVVTAPGQFEGVGAPGTFKRGQFDSISEDSEQFKKALENITKVLQGVDTTGGAVNFFAPGPQALLGRPTPAFADYNKMTVGRAGQQFFTGTFPGDKGLGGPAGDTTAVTQDSLKAGNDIIAALQKQLQVTEDLTDAEKVRKAGLDAVKQAQDKGVVDPAQIETIKQIAEADAKRKVDIERQAKARALETELANENLATQKAGAQSLDAILSALDRKAASTKAKIDQAEKEGVSQVGGQTLDVLRAQVDANTQIAKQQATQKFYSDQLAALDKQRADAQQKIANQVKNGTLTPAQAVGELADLTARLDPQYKSIAESAQKFKEALGSAAVTPETQAFLDRVSTGGSDAGGANAKASLELLNDSYAQLNAAISERNSLVQTNNALQQQGAISAAELEEKNRAAYEGAAPAIQAQIDAMRQLIEMLKGLPGFTDAAYNAWIAKLQLVKTQMNFVDTAANRISNTIGNDFANGVVGAFDRFAESVASGANVFDSLKDAFLQFAADFLRQIAQMIIKQAIFNALGMGAGGQGSAGGILGSIGTAIAGMFHEGGVVGQSGGLRAVQPAWFKNAYRYHQGGIAGLAPGEVPAILEKNEEVLTRNDPRHVMNGGAAAGTRGDIKVVNVFDAADLLEKALATKSGEKVLLNYVRQNKGAFQSAMG